MGKARVTKRKWRSAARGAPRVTAALLRLGARIRAVRADRGLTQEQTAERAQLDVKHVQAIEAGTVNVTVATLVGLGVALDATLAELCEGSA